MPRRILMGELVTRCAQHADKTGDSHIEAPEWKSRISLKYGELWGIVSGAGLRYFEKKSTINANGAASYLEPEDHLSTIGMDYVRSDGTRTEIYELMISERNALAGMVGDARYFELVDDEIRLYPRPSSGTYELLYIPQPTNLTQYADDGVVDVVNEAGEAMLIWGVAAGAKDKSESDLRYCLDQEREAKVRLRDWAINRSLTQPRRRVITDLAELGALRQGDWRLYR